MVWTGGWAICWLGRADYWAGACAWVGRRAALAWAALAGGLGGQLLAALEAVGRAGGWASVLRSGWRRSRRAKRMPFPHTQKLSSQWALLGSGPRLSSAATCAHGCARCVARRRVSPGVPSKCCGSLSLSLRYASHMSAIDPPPVDCSTAQDPVCF